MGDRRRRSRAMQMAQFQARLDIEDAEMIKAEVELANSLMQYEHHAESSHRGSVMGRSFVQHDREEYHDQMMKHYFIERPRFPAHDFQRWFLMRRKLFDSILNAVINHDHYFARKIDVVSQQSLSPHQKLTSAFRMLAKGCSADSTDEYCRLADSTVIEGLKCFYQAIQAIYRATYLRKPNREDLKRLLRKADKRGFPGMIESLNYMHWEWKNCPTAWTGQFKGRHNKPTIVLKAMASYETWIWHAFFGTSGSNNNINFLWFSPLFDDVVNGWAPKFQYKVNGNRYEIGYYLTDGIYPSWSTFVKSFSHLNSSKKKLFSQRQVFYRKDVERAFRILQARWAIVRGPARLWHTEDLHSIMMTCIILHNMIVKDEYIKIEEDSDEDVDDDQPTYARAIARDVEYLAETTYETRHDRVILSEYMRRLNIIQAPQGHDTLRKDLAKHVWRREGER